MCVLSIVAMSIMLIITMKNVWQGGFGRLILGEKWIAHPGAYGQQSILVTVAEASQNHPIFNRILPGTIWGATDVYSIR